MEDYSKKKISIIAAVLVGFVVVVVLMSIVMMILNQKHYKLVIDNIDSCSSGISSRSKDNLFDGLYSVLKNQNLVEDKKEKEGSYHSTIREETCKTTAAENYKYTSALVDIEEAGYSYKIEYYWVEKDDEYIDLGPITAVCLDDSELKYGSFKCDDNPITITEFENDPILRLLPYVGDGYVIYPRIGTRDGGEEYYYIEIVYDPPESAYDNDTVYEFKLEHKQYALDYLESQGLDINKYPIKEKLKTI